MQVDSDPNVLFYYPSNKKKISETHPLRIVQIHNNQILKGALLVFQECSSYFYEYSWCVGQ